MGNSNLIALCFMWSGKLCKCWNDKYYITTTHPVCPSFINPSMRSTQQFSLPADTGFNSCEFQKHSQPPRSTPPPHMFFSPISIGHTDQYLCHKINTYAQWLTNVLDHLSWKKKNDCRTALQTLKITVMVKNNNYF